MSTDSHPAINGTGHAGDTINVFDGSTLLGSTSIDASGHWSFTPANALTNGVHTITASETNTAGTSAASAAYPLDVANIMITAVHDANGHLVANGGVTAGAILITGWISDPSVIENGLALDLSGGNVGNTRIPGADFTVTGHTFTVAVSGDSFTGYGGDQAYPTNGTFTLGVQAFGSAGHIVTLLDPQLAYTITDNFNATAQQVSATQAAAVIDTADTAVAASATTDTSHHVALGEHDAFTATTSHATIDLNVDPAAYFAQATAHIQGASGAANTVHLTGDHQVLDLTSLSGHTAASKISGVEAVDLGGAHNTLKLSLSDVLNLGQSDMFEQDGHIQMLVKGSNGDSVDLSNAHIAGITNGQWTQEGASVIGGVTYNVYEHSGAHAELLVQQGVQIALHA